MKSLKFVVALGLVAGLVSPAVLAQESGTGATGKCQESPAAVSQMPLVQNGVVLKYPWEWNELRGTWRARSGRQLVVERGCSGGHGGACATLLPGAKDGPCFAGSIELALFLGLVKPGKYEVEWAANEGGAAIGPIILTIQEPQGVDKEVYEKLLLPAWANRIAQADWGGWLLGAYTRDKPSTASQILEQYPTSIYAGYSLLSGGECIPDPRVFLTDLLSYDKHAEKEPSSAGQMASDKKRSLEADRKRVDQLSTYLKAQPNFAMADCLKVELAGRFAALDRFDEAQCICEELLKKAPESYEASRARLLLDFLKTKGFVKPRGS